VLSLSPVVRVFVCRMPVDFRRGFDGLAQIVRDHLHGDPLAGHLFVFFNRRADRLKTLVWQEDGFALYYKRLEEGTFRIPSYGDGGALELSATELAMLLDGVILESVRRGKRYHRPASAAAPTPI
jgi:transposase